MPRTNLTDLPRQRPARRQPQGHGRLPTPHSLGRRRGPRQSRFFQKHCSVVTVGREGPRGRPGDRARPTTWEQQTRDSFEGLRPSARPEPRGGPAVVNYQVTTTGGRQSPACSPPRTYDRASPSSAPKGPRHDPADELESDAGHRQRSCRGDGKQLSKQDFGMSSSSWPSRDNRRTEAPCHEISSRTLIVRRHGGFRRPAAEPARRPPRSSIHSRRDSATGLGCYGQKMIRTPNLDRMAAEGMRVHNGYGR